MCRHNLICRHVCGRNSGACCDWHNAAVRHVTCHRRGSLICQHIGFAAAVNPRSSVPRYTKKGRGLWSVGACVQVWSVNTSDFLQLCFLAAMFSATPKGAGPVVGGSLRASGWIWRRGTCSDMPCDLLGKHSISLATTLELSATPWPSTRHIIYSLSVCG